MSKEIGQEELSIKVPLITEEEIRNIDNNMETIVNTITKQIISDKDLAIAQYIIQKLQKENKNYKRMLAEIHAQSLNSSIAEKEKHEEELEVLNEGWKIELEKKDKMIDEMAEVMSAICTDITSIRELFEKSYCEFINSEEDCCWKTDKTCKDCIIQYFERKAEKSSSINTIQEEK